MNKPVLFCVALCLLAVSSCKKKEDDPSRTELLTNGKWRITASKSHVTTGSNTVTEDNYLGFRDCEKDDLSIFRTDNHLMSDQGATKCDPADPQQTDEGIWSLTEQDTKLMVVSSIFAESFKINTLSGSTLEIEFSDTSASVISRQVVTFSHVD